jgi:hypothetical protein
VLTGRIRNNIERLHERDDPNREGKPVQTAPQTWLASACRRKKRQLPRIDLAHWQTGQALQDVGRERRDRAEGRLRRDARGYHAAPQLFAGCGEPHFKLGAMTNCLRSFLFDRHKTIARKAVVPAEMDGVDDVGVQECQIACNRDPLFAPNCDPLTA